MLRAENFVNAKSQIYSYLKLISVFAKFVKKFPMCLSEQGKNNLTNRRNHVVFKILEDMYFSIKKTKTENKQKNPTKPKTKKKKPNPKPNKL